MDFSSYGDVERERCDLEAAESENEFKTPKRGRGRWGSSCSPPIIPLADPQVGTIVWAKVKNSRWWPAIIVNKDDCGKLADISGGRGRATLHYVYWFGDSRISAVTKSNLVDFIEGYKRFVVPSGGKSFRSGLYVAISEIRKMQQVEMEGWDWASAVSWADDGFPSPNSHIVKKSGNISQLVREKLHTLKEKYVDSDHEDDDIDSHNDDDSVIQCSSEEIELMSSIRDESLSLQEICLACVTTGKILQEHPLFFGGVCKPCMEKILERSFSIGLDQAAFYCCICMDLGDLLLCSQSQCYRSYCSKCIVLKAAVGVLNIIRESEPWYCFLCEPYKPEIHGLLRPHSDWKTRMWKLFHVGVPNLHVLKQIPLRIMCCDSSFETVFTILTHFARLGIKIETLLLCNFASNELKKLQPVLPSNVELKTASEEYQDCDTLYELLPIHVLISSINDNDTDSLGQKFFTFHGILSNLNILNANCCNLATPVMWVLESTSIDCHEYNTLISRYLEFDPASWADEFEDKKSLVWTNISSLWTLLKVQSTAPIKNRKPKIKSTGVQPRDREEVDKERQGTTGDPENARKRKKWSQILPISSRVTRSKGTAD